MADRIHRHALRSRRDAATPEASPPASRASPGSRQVELPSRGPAPIAAPAPRSPDAAASLRMLGATRTGKRRADAAEADEAISVPAPFFRRTMRTGEASASLAPVFEEPADDDAPDPMHVGGQRAIAVPVGRLGEPTVRPAAAVAPVARPARSTSTAVFQRLPFRCRDNGELIREEYALQRPDGTLDQTQCDPRCAYLGASYDDEFLEMARRWLNVEGADEDVAEAAVARLLERNRSNYDKMINNQPLPILANFHASPLQASHCYGKEQYANLQKGLSPGAQPEGVLLHDHEDQQPWSQSMPCANISVPPGEVRNYAARHGQATFDDFAIQVNVPTGTGRKPHYRKWHAALHGCGLAQFFNGSEPGQPFHWVFVNTTIRMRDREGKYREEHTPDAIMVARAPPGKQPLAWYGKGYFQWRPLLLARVEPSPAPAIESLDAASEAVSEPGDRPEVQGEHEVRRGRWSERVPALKDARDRDRIVSLKVELQRSEPVQSGALPTRVSNHLHRAIDFIQAIDRPFDDWLREHGQDAGPAEQRFEALMQAAASVSLPPAANNLRGLDTWRLKPLMQQALGLPVVMEYRTPDKRPAGIDINLPAAGHVDNRMQLIVLKASVEARLPRQQRSPRREARRVELDQQRIVDPAISLMAGLGARSALDWVRENLTVPPSGPSEAHVEALLACARDQGVVNRRYRSRYLPILRQLLGLPIHFAQWKLATSPLHPYLSELGSSGFDPAVWQQRVPGFADLPDDAARAVLQMMWTNSLGKIERQSMSARQKTPLITRARRPIREAVEVFKHWGGSEAVHAWLADRDLGPDEGLSLDERWLHLLPDLRGELSHLPNPRLLEAKRLVTTLLTLADIEPDDNV